MGLPPSSGATPVAVIWSSLSTTKVGCAGRLGAVAVGAGVWVTVGSGTSNDQDAFPASTVWSVARRVVGQGQGGVVVGEALYVVGEG